MFLCNHWILRIWIYCYLRCVYTLQKCSSLFHQHYWTCTGTFNACIIMYTTCRLHRFFHGHVHIIRCLPISIDIKLNMAEIVFHIRRPIYYLSMYGCVGFWPGLLQSMGAMNWKAHYHRHYDQKYTIKYCRYRWSTLSFSFVPKYLLNTCLLLSLALALSISFALFVPRSFSLRSIDRFGCFP